MKNIENSGLEKHVIQSINKQAQITMNNKGKRNTGDKIPIIVGKTEHYVNNEQKELATEEQPPRCAARHCSSVSPEVHKICHDFKYPPGHLILVCNPSTGECCYCNC